MILAGDMAALTLSVARELKMRADGLATPLGFTLYTFPTYRQNWHHQLISDKLLDVLEGRCKRLMIFMPPRHGKTELASRRFPAFAFGRNPDLKIIAASYSGDLTANINRDVQRIIDNERYANLFPNTKLMGASVRDTSRGEYLRNTDEFEIVNHQGYYKGVGIMGGLTGRGFDIGIIDDPIKDRLEANSRTYRDRVHDWYNSVFYTRRNNDDAAIVIIQTRWHQDDLAGRILAEDKKNEWTVLNLPAIQDAPASSYDSRQIGEAIWPDLFSVEALRDIEAKIGAYEFAALYQGRPTPKGGQMFDVSRFRVVQQVPGQILKAVRYWDKAGSKDAGCYTSGVKMYLTEDGVVVVADVVRGRWEALERERRIRQCAEMDGRKVTIHVEQEPGSGGKESAEATVRNLRGFNVRPDRVTGDKIERAQPYAAQQCAGNVLLLAGSWNKEFVSEHETAPSGTYRDQWDSAAGAFNKLAGNKVIRPHAGTDGVATSNRILPGELPLDVLAIIAQAKTPEERKALEQVAIEELSRT